MGKSALLSSEGGYVGNFWGFIKGVKYSSVFQEGTLDFLETLQCKRSSSPVEGRISWFFVKLWWDD